MFGIGLPELILIMAVALVVVGPEKLPEMAKSLAKGVMELKKTASALKDSLNEVDEDAGKPWEQIEPEEYPPGGPKVNEYPESFDEKDISLAKAAQKESDTAQDDVSEPADEEEPKDT